MDPGPLGRGGSTPHAVGLFSTEGEDKARALPRTSGAGPAELVVDEWVRGVGPGTFTRREERARRAFLAREEPGIRAHVRGGHELEVLDGVSSHGRISSRYMISLHEGLLAVVPASGEINNDPWRGCGNPSAVRSGGECPQTAPVLVLLSADGKQDTTARGDDAVDRPPIVGRHFERPAEPAAFAGVVCSPPDIRTTSARGLRTSARPQGTTIRK
jgi:hypothetical protein